MRRWKAEVQAAIPASGVGLEIGPFYQPMAPRREGFQTTIVDIKSRAELEQSARSRGATELQIAEIEDVDIVGDASNLAELLSRHNPAARFDWIISSHNFEHLIDPLKFLQDCEALLKEGGVLMMVIPDHRFTFDRFHPQTISADVIEAAGRPRGSSLDAWACFREASQQALLKDEGAQHRLAWARSEHDDHSMFIKNPLVVIHKRLKARLASPEFSFHGHRWYFTPAVFELVLFDLLHLGLLNLRLSEIQPTVGFDFLVILQATNVQEPLSPDQICAQRLDLLRRVEDERAEVSSVVQKQQRQLEALELQVQQLRARLDVLES